MTKRIRLEQIKKGNSASLHYAWIVQPCTNEMPLLFHPEIEIKHIVEGAGYRMTGDYLEPFEKGEVVLTPSNLPHSWIYSPDSFDSNGNRESIVVQFSPELLSKGISFFSELQYAANRLLMIQQSVRITGKTSEAVIRSLKEMLHLDNTAKLLTFIKIVQLVGTSEDLVPIGIQSTVVNNITKNMNRIQLVYKYIIENYKERVSLEDVARVAGMSQNAFCAFFKRETGKTFCAFINEYRIEMACNLLRSFKDLEISEVAWKCGFSDIPYFNRCFKRITGTTPSQWRI